MDSYKAWAPFEYELTVASVAPSFLGAAQAFAHDCLAKPALLVVRVGANRLKDRRPRDVVKPDRTKRSELSIRGDREDIQVAAVDGYTLNVPVPFPALIFFVGLIGMEDLP